ncbi:MAG TPA: putative Ig domain-containing protein, partial [Blastocatellia bacterium]|nr:putative Ig domain-containing protein [Blastocatellia bacterium]
PFTFVNSTISNNTSTGAGQGAGFWNRYGTGTITGCTINDNRASVSGALHNEGDMTIVNSTISGNRADISGGFAGNGGGIINQGPALRLYNCTITGNVGSVGGGIQTQGGFHTVMKNCIVAGNTSTFGGSTPYDLEKTGTDGFNDSVLGASTFNLIGSVTKSGGLTNGVNNNIVGNNGSGTVPIANILSPLANNGGPTLTHALASNSPALDNGSNAAIPSGVTTDQRGAGFARIVNTTVDRGAVEKEGASLAPTFTTCPTSQTVNATTAACNAAVSFAPVATGLPSPTVTCKIGATTITSPYNFPVGTSNVACTASNGVAPDAVCNFSVTVNDTQAPALIGCPGNQTATATSSAGAVVNYTPPTANDNCGTVPVMCSPVSGSTFALGTTNVTCTATDAANLTSSCNFSVTVNCPVITLTSSLPGGSVGTSYNQSVAASPAGTYSYSVTAGALPAGLTLSGGTGAITGSPTATGSYSFTITATNGVCSGSQNYTLPVTITAATSMPNAQAGVAYSYTVTPTPPGTYTFSLLTGSLPSGVSLNSATGVISGTPATTGNFSFTILAQTAGGFTTTPTFTLTIGCPTVTLSPASLPNGTAGTAYSQTLSASPAGGIYSYAVTSGSLPSGLNLNSATGALSGTPTINGSFNFTVTATGFGTCTGSQAYSVAIGSGGCSTITLPASLPNGTVGGLYSNAVAASPAGTYSYAVSSGTLPPGVTLYSSFGLIFGFPTAAGSYTFTLTATQGACTGSQTYTVLISAGFASSLAVASDFDGDLKSDVSVFRADGNWEVANSREGQTKTTLWGAPYAPYYDLSVSGDYDGDGKTDLAVFRRGTEGAGHWFIKRSSDGGVNIHFWGLPTDVPVPGDYDGDGKTDVAVWRGSEGVWFVIRSSDGAATAGFWGTDSLNDTPVPGDYDGDGKTDYAVFRRSGAQAGHWLIKRSSDGKPLDVKWGLPTDAPVPGDYDGDNKTDYAVWRATEGIWYWVESGSAALRTLTLGASDDVPVPTDYDGDGKADAAVWQPATGKWQIKRSNDGTMLFKTLGRSNDLPIPGRRN